MPQPNNRYSEAVRNQPVAATGTQAGDQRQLPRPLHLHIIWDSKDHALATISEKIRSEFTDGQTVDHLHSPIRNRRQLGRTLRNVEAAPGMVIYSLSNQDFAKELVKSCKRLDIPCLAVPKPSSGKEAKTSRLLQAGILASLTLFFIWAIATKSLITYVADADAETALDYLSINPAALINLADAKLKPAKERLGEQLVPQVAGKQQEISPSPEYEANLEAEAPAGRTMPEFQSLAEIRSLLESALRKDPLNARAFNLLGQVAKLENDEQQAERFMQAAVRRSLRITYPAYWLLIRSYEDQKFATAIRYADILLRARSGSGKNVIPILAKIAEIPDASAGLRQVLLDNPPWRSDFFRRLPNNVSDARTPLDLFLAIETTSAPSTAEDRLGYISFLVERGFYDLAYYVWLQFLPTEQLNSLGRLFNGDFETSLLGKPFDWNFNNQAGVIIEVVDHPDHDGRALFMRFGPGRVDFAGPEQLVMLPPGKYQFQGKQKARLLSKTGLFWQVSCVNRPKKSSVRIGQGPVIEGRELVWKNFTFSFTVPDSDCPAQYVRLASGARSASEQFISGSLWFDDLQIVGEPAINP